MKKLLKFHKGDWPWLLIGAVAGWYLYKNIRANSQLAACLALGNCGAYLSRQPAARPRLGAIADNRADLAARV